MTEFNVKQMLDPVRFAREEGRLQGRLEMRELLAQDVAKMMATETDAKTAEALWALSMHLRAMSIS